MPDLVKFSRRGLLGSLAAAGAASFLRVSPLAAQTPQILTRPIPSSGEAMPLIGLGSWITFNVGFDPEARASCAEVIAAFIQQGGRMIDSSPMYGSAQEVIGWSLNKLGNPQTLFSADKVWVTGGENGPEQITQSREHWGIARFDLLQVHNLRSWQEHMPTLLAMKEAGQLRYVGITTSEGRRHREFIEVMRSQPLDFIQVSYNAIDREVEERILPLAQDRGIAVIINRPFQQSVLIDHVKRHPLPEWAAEFEAENWAQFLLKFIISHPAVTCAIPATTRVAHLQENMGAARGLMPDKKMRRRMAAHVEQL